MSEIHKIFLKSVNWIGDVIMTTPAIHFLREHYSGARIVISARPWVAELLKHNPDIDEIWKEEGTEKESAKSILLSKIKEAEFDLGIALPNSFGSAWPMYKGKIKRRIGYARDLRSFFLTDAIKCDKEILKQHQVEYYLNLLRPLMDVSEGERSLVLNVDPGAEKSVGEFLEKNGIDGHEKIIGLNPGAFFGTAKRWFPERFAKLADRLHELTGWKVAAIGTGKERPVGEEIQKNCSTDILLTQGELNLQEAIALIDRMSLMISNDSGAMHIAAARGVPMIAVFGSTDWRTTYPYHPNSKVVRKETSCAPCLLRECPIDHRCMDRVEVEDVFVEAEKLVGEVKWV